ARCLRALRKRPFHCDECGEKSTARAHSAGADHKELVQCSTSLHFPGRSRNHPRQEGSRDTQVGRSTVFHPNKRELMMLTSVRSHLAATILAGSVLAASPALAQDEGAASPITVSGNAAVTSDYRF